MASVKTSPECCSCVLKASPQSLPEPSPQSITSKSLPSHHPKPPPQRASHATPAKSLPSHYPKNPSNHHPKSLPSTTPKHLPNHHSKASPQSLPPPQTASQTTTPKPFNHSKAFQPPPQRPSNHHPKKPPKVEGTSPDISELAFLQAQKQSRTHTAPLAHCTLLLAPH